MATAGAPTPRPTSSCNSIAAPSAARSSSTRLKTKLSRLLHSDRWMDRKPYLIRNRAIVACCDEPVAAPKTPVEELRSGTWATSDTPARPTSLFTFEAVANRHPAALSSCAVKHHTTNRRSPWLCPPTPHTITPPTKPSENLAPTTKVAPDEGHPNAADKPWYERPAHAGAIEAEAAAWPPTSAGPTSGPAPRTTSYFSGDVRPGKAVMNRSLAPVPMVPCCLACGASLVRSPARSGRPLGRMPEATYAGVLSDQVFSW